MYKRNSNTDARTDRREPGETVSRRIILQELKMTTLVSLVSYCVFVVFTSTSVPGALGLPIKEHTQGSGRSGRVARSVRDILCPEGTSKKDCFYNHLSLFLTIQHPDATDSRSIGKSSLGSMEAYHTGSDVIDEPNMDDIALMLQYNDLLSGDLNSGGKDVLKQLIQSDEFTDLLDSRDFLVSNSDEEYPTRDSLLKSGNSDEALLDYLYKSLHDKNDDESSRLYRVNKKSFQRPVSVRKRQLACTGDAYKCFMNSLQYYLDIQNAMNKKV